MSWPELKFIPEEENHVQSEYAGGRRAKVQSRRRNDEKKFIVKSSYMRALFESAGTFSNDENKIVE